ncbi:hypothetical protein EIP86_006214 [Pleurotus ostreatoroseus]|nr:hypothetical protein EIP86_006214 [Pleurotus ostreatoroseus]
MAILRRVAYLTSVSGQPSSASEFRIERRTVNKPVLNTASTAFDTPAQLTATLASIRKALVVPPSAPLPLGVGLLGWVLDKTEASEDPRLPAVLAQRPRAVYFAFGDNLGQYVRQVRAYDARRADADGHAHRTLVWVCVNTLEEARVAVEEWGVDVLVAQGIEAGGHGSSAAPPLSILLTSILRALPTCPPLVAAGGIATGAQTASLLTLGAAGVLLGTRLLLTPECGYTPAQKALLCTAGTTTARGLCFDEVNRTTGWPEGVDGRAVVNGIWRDAAEGVEVEERMRRFDEAKARGDGERILVWAGAGVGLAKEVKGAGEVVKEVHEEAVRSLRMACAMVSF